MQLDLKEIDFINGVGDQMSLVINRSKGGLWFSTSWNGTKTVLKEIQPGSNVSIYVAAPTMITSANREEFPVAQSTLNAVAIPNPTQSYSTIKLESSNRLEPILLRVVDQTGRVIEVKNALSAGQTLQLGAGYKNGIYFVEVIQGSQRRQLKLVKQ